MADFLTVAERSQRMARIRSKDTKPELVVRRSLWAAGFRYRLHRKGLPGRPDIVFPAAKIAVFVHGCYWHGHVCQSKRKAGANAEFWASKFKANKARDRRNRLALRREGWRVVTIWECSLSNAAKRANSLRGLLDLLAQVRDNTSPDRP